MRIWLITVGEPLPTDKANNRLLRTGILANLLCKKGHVVVWWSSTFNHTLKKQRYNSDSLIDVTNRFKIYLLHSISYQKNISIRRIVNHYGVARKFRRLAETEPRPDVIVCSLPTVELCSVATEYGKKNCVPVVIDIRDLWPDIFFEILPSWAQCLGRYFIYPMVKNVRYACANATAITGITGAYVDWGVKYAGRERSIFDKDFPLGYSESAPGDDDILRSKIFWERYGISRKSDEFIACFFGTMGRQFEIETVIQAARILKRQKRDFRFVLCGSGDNLAYYKNLARDCDSIVFPGWVEAGEIWSLMRYSSVGLAPYLSIDNFMKNLPNKPVEYFSAGLPVVSSLKGLLEEVLEAHKCGVTYENGNVEDLTSALINLYDNRDLLKKMSENAYALFKEKYVAEKVYGDMIDYLESIKVRGDVNNDGFS